MTKRRLPLVFCFALVSAALWAAPSLAVDFGDDGSAYARDGQCDDSRFTGAGAAAFQIDADVMHDATDCQMAFDAGNVVLAEEGAAPDTALPADSEIAPDAEVAPVGMPADTIDFGDDTSAFANDSECDDPRFSGEGASGTMLDGDLMHDASDCSAAFDAGTIALMPETASAPEANAGEVDFGDDSSAYSNDGECDDPRFIGEGAAETRLNEDILHDATDCRAQFEAGAVTVVVPPEPGSGTGQELDGIAFGDDASSYANDAECDDPRFIGAGAAESNQEGDRGHDATDCFAAYQAETVTLASEDDRGLSALPADPGPLTEIDEIAFGDDSSEWASDGECDDLRFAVGGVAGENAPADEGHDAADCKALYARGAVALISLDPGSYIWGESDGSWPDDDECDDNRFAGPGRAVDAPNDEDRFRDGADCRAGYLGGRLLLLPIDTAGIDFGDDEGSWPNDRECDDERFEGRGMSDAETPESNFHDAGDCSWAFAQGAVTLIAVQGAAAASDRLQFGDNSSKLAKDGECNDPRFIGEGASDAGSDADLMHDASDCRTALKRGLVQVR